jgi:hypothetical protein
MIIMQVQYVSNQCPIFSVFILQDIEYSALVGQVLYLKSTVFWS